MTEQQAPTLAAVIGVDSLYMAPGLHPSDFPIGTKLYALAKNIDTASPSPASLQEQVLAAIKEEYCSEPQDDEDVAYDAGVGDALAAAMRAFRLATPQPSPTSGVTWTAEEVDEACAAAVRRAQAKGAAPTGPREGEPTYTLDEIGQACADTDIHDPMFERLAIALETNRDDAPETATPSLPLQEPVAAQIEAGWRKTFSTENPFCPCDLKSFTKAVRWAVDTLAAPSLPAVLTDATCRDAARYRWLCERLAWNDDDPAPWFYFKLAEEVPSLEVLDEAIDRALATSATPVLP